MFTPDMFTIENTPQGVELTFHTLEDAEKFISDNVDYYIDEYLEDKGGIDALHEYFIE